MLVVVQGGAGMAFLAAGAACAAAAMAGGRRLPAAFAFCAALIAAAVADLGGDGSVAWELAIAAATAGLVAIVLLRFESVPALSWLDAIMGASAVAALAADVDADPLVVAALAGATGGLALSRWQVCPQMLLAAAGILALGAGDSALAVVAAPLLAVAAWHDQGRTEAGPEFRWTVLAAIILFAFSALTILAINQFATISDTAGALA